MSAAPSARRSAIRGIDLPHKPDARQLELPQPAYRIPLPRQLVLLRPSRRNHRWTDGSRCDRCGCEREIWHEVTARTMRLVLYRYRRGDSAWSRSRPDCGRPGASALAKRKGDAS